MNQILANFFVDFSPRSCINSKSDFSWMEFFPTIPVTKKKLRALNRYLLDIFGPCTPSPATTISGRAGHNESWEQGDCDVNAARQLRLDDGNGDCDGDNIDSVIMASSSSNSSNSNSGDGGSSSNSSNSSSNRQLQLDDGSNSKKRKRPSSNSSRGC